MKIPVELKKKYLQRRIEEIEHLFCSLEANDFSVALRLGHQVKGNAQTFEFPQFAPLGIKIEQAAKERDKEGVARLTHIMKAELHAAQTLFH